MTHSNESPQTKGGTNSRCNGQTSAYYLALLLLAIFALYPRLSTGFTTQDDTNISLMAKSWHTLLPNASYNAVVTGRFFAGFLILDLAVPYLIDSQLYYYALTIGALVVNILCFYALIRRIFRSSDIAVLITALALAFLPNNWQHNPLTAYPFAYSIAMACLLGSFISFLSWRCGSGIVPGIVTAVLYFLALLTTEAFALYCTIFFCLSVTTAFDGGSRSYRIKRIARAFSPIAVSLLLYVLLYLLFKRTHPGHYEGVQLAAGNLSRTAAVIWQYATSTLPGYYYFHDSPRMLVAYDGVAPVWGINGLVQSLRVEWIVKAMILCWLCASILRSKGAYVTKRYIGLLPLGILAIFAPVTLVGLTVKYQHKVIDSHSLGYVHSYFAFFGTAFVLGLLILLGKRLAALSRRLSAVYPIVVALALAIPSLATDRYNYYITRDQQLSNLKWRMIDEVSSTDAIKTIPYRTIIYAPSLWTYRGIVENLPGYWSAYLSWRTGKQLTVCRTLEEFDSARRERAGHATYFLSYHQEPKDANQFMVLAKAPYVPYVSTNTVYSTKATLFTYSKYRDFVLIGRYRPGEPANIRVDNQAVTEVSENAFAHEITKSNSPTDLPRTTIESSVLIDVANLTISFFPVVPYLTSFKIDYGRGFYGVEEDRAAHLIWNWASGNAEMSIWNRSEQRVDNCVNLRLVTLTTPRTVTIDVNGHQESVAFRDGVTISSTVSLPVSLVPGENKIYFTTDRPAQRPNGDTRAIAFGVQNVELCKLHK